MKKLVFISALFIFASWSDVQAQDRSGLFENPGPLELKLDFSFKQLKKETNDSTLMEEVMYYREGSADWDSIKVQMRKRGNFRLQNCYFPPVKLNIKKKERKETIFEDDKKLKLVLPCLNTKATNALIIKEYLCYQIYEKVTPFSFHTRLTPVEVTEHRKNKDKVFNLLAFLVEDDKQVAKRNNGEIMKDAIVHPLRLHDTTAVRFAIFQYLIANMDWSTVYQHNAKVMKTKDPYRLIPLAYDFDQSGFVDASYAILNPEWESAAVNPANVRADVKDRIYRGYCRENDPLMYAVRDEYLVIEDEVYGIIEAYKKYLDDTDYKSLQKFVEGFFDTLEDNEAFKTEIIDRCRTK